jgi:ubiquinone/menaquinone biosynthesis C-methylase UbiE
MNQGVLRPVDYDERQHAGYVAGRDLGPEHALAWAQAFATHAPAHRPLTALDLGAGTGRFTSALAQTFGGPCYGVEPSERMRAAAIARTTDERVQFLPGRAESIPLPDASCDIVLMFLSFHHVRDRDAAVAEIARVLRANGRVFIRSQFSDRFPDLCWHAHFPRAREIELAMFPTLTEVEAVFARVGLKRTALFSVEEHFADSLAEHADKLRHRAISTFEHLSEAEISQGFARLDAAVAEQTRAKPVTARSDVLVLG